MCKEAVPFSTASLHTEILDFRGFASSRILIFRGGILMSIGNLPANVESTNLSNAGMILVGRLGVSFKAWSLPFQCDSRLQTGFVQLPAMSFQALPVGDSVEQYKLQTSGGVLFLDFPAICKFSAPALFLLFLCMGKRCICYPLCRAFGHKAWICTRMYVSVRIFRISRCSYTLLDRMLARMCMFR